VQRLFQHSSSLTRTRFSNGIPAIATQPVLQSQKVIGIQPAQAHPNGSLSRVWNRVIDNTGAHDKAALKLAFVQNVGNNKPPSRQKDVPVPSRNVIKPKMRPRGKNAKQAALEVVFKKESRSAHQGTIVIKTRQSNQKTIQISCPTRNRPQSGPSRKKQPRLHHSWQSADRPRGPGVGARHGRAGSQKVNGNARGNLVKHPSKNQDSARGIYSGDARNKGPRDFQGSTVNHKAAHNRPRLAACHRFMPGPTHALYSVRGHYAAPDPAPRANAFQNPIQPGRDDSDGGFPRK